MRVLIVQNEAWCTHCSSLSLFKLYMMHQGIEYFLQKIIFIATTLWQSEKKTAHCLADS